MARPREFEIDTAIDDAMHVFWRLGYDGARLPDLLDGIGITRGSFYKAFTDKKSLFLRAMATYETEIVNPAIAMLEDPSEPDGTKRIATLFHSITQATQNGDQRGCLLCSAAAGPAAEDTDISTIVHKMLSRLQGGFQTALNCTDGTHNAAQSSHLLSHYVGLRVLARAHAPHALLEASIASQLQNLSRHDA